MKKKIVIAALALAMLPGMAFAADFSGTFARDPAASSPSAWPIYWITRDIPAGGGGGGGQAVITVKQSKTTLEITDPARIIRKLALDGKPYVVNHETGVVKQTVTTAVQGDNIVVTTVQPYSGLPGSVTTNVKDTWSLSPDGKVLTVTTVRSTPALADVTTKQVYNKR